jgi:hypothetical protein
MEFVTVGQLLPEQLELELELVQVLEPMQEPLALPRASRMSR